MYVNVNVNVDVDVPFHLWAGIFPPAPLLPACVTAHECRGAGTGGGLEGAEAGAGGSHYGRPQKETPSVET